MAAVVDPIPFYVGDDWPVGPVTFATKDGPVDFTGAQFNAVFYSSAQDTGTDMMAAGMLKFNANPLLGQIDTVTIPRGLTKDVLPRADNATGYPVRAIIQVVNALNVARTRLIIRYNPRSARKEEGAA